MTELVSATYRIEIVEGMGRAPETIGAAVADAYESHSWSSTVPPAYPDDCQLGERVTKRYVALVVKNPKCPHPIEMGGFILDDRGETDWIAHLVLG